MVAASKKIHTIKQQKYSHGTIGAPAGAGRKHNIAFQSKFSGKTYKLDYDGPVFNNYFRIKMKGSLRYAGFLGGEMLWYDEINDIYNRFFVDHKSIDFTPYVREGKAAFEGGMPIESNPYDRKKDPVKHSLWHRGWLAMTKNYEVPSDD